MALFSSLSEKLGHIFSKLTKRGRLTELEIKEAMREVRIALLEADVNYMVAKKFVADVSERKIIVIPQNPYRLFMNGTLTPKIQVMMCIIRRTQTEFFES